MPQTKTQRRPAKAGTAGAKKAAATRKRGGPARMQETSATVKRATDLSDDVLRELEDGAERALDAVRKFLGTVDDALPPQAEGPSRREEITDSALEMAQRLVHTQADFLRKVVDSAGKSLSRSDAAK
jgi:hypothetical protein